jgi:hypothetical protein
MVSVSVAVASTVVVESENSVTVATVRGTNSVDVASIVVVSAVSTVKVAASTSTV